MNALQIEKKYHSIAKSVVNAERTRHTTSVKVGEHIKTTIKIMKKCLKRRNFYVFQFLEISDDGVLII